MPNPSESLPADTHIESVALSVPDMARALQFYQEVLGLDLNRRTENGENSAELGAGGKEILFLSESPGASPPPPRATGLYHFAILVPSRPALAHALLRLVQRRWPLQGFANHGVSEAIYLADPDGNGIEIYRDLPRAEWPMKNGQLQMTSDPLDVDGLLAELGEQRTPNPAMDPATRLGHIHLKVADISKAVAFYVDILGFDLMQRFGSQAGFVSAGGYHHHIGFNTWESANGVPPPPGSLGLRYFSVRLPEAASLKMVLERIRRAGLPLEQVEQGWEVRDPSQNGVILIK